MSFPNKSVPLSLSYVRKKHSSFDLTCVVIVLLFYDKTEAIGALFNSSIKD